MNFDTVELIQKVAAFFPIFLFSICFHEFSHGLVAKWRGDNTAQIMGRLTLNPFAHADLLGTVIFPIIGVMTGFFFGWAKPVPVDERNLKNPKADMFWIALAGPASNVFLALLGGIVIALSFKFFYGAPLQKTIMDLGQIFMITNLSLAVFNAIPLHPLDGGKILARFIPDRWDRWLEENQTLLFFALIIILQTPMAALLQWPARVIYFLILNLVGLV